MRLTKTVRLPVCAALVTLLMASGSTRSMGQSAGPTAAGAGLSIVGDIARPTTWMPADLKAMPRVAVTVQENGQPVVYGGVSIGELLGRAGAPLGRELRGDALATCVRASATDGYEVVFSLAELDPAMTANEVIVADTVDGKPLFDYQGPLRLVAPRDKRPARSVRMLVRLDVVRLKK